MTRSKVDYLALLALGAMYGGVAACAEREQTAASGTVESVDLGVTEPVPETKSGEPRNVDEQLLIAKEDLASRFGIDAGEIEVKTVRHVHWRSGATGCPSPGMSYTMAVVPGVLILLRADGEDYRYHGRRNGTPSYCPADRAEAPVFGQGEEAM